MKMAHAQGKIRSKYQQTKKCEMAKDNFLRADLCFMYCPPRGVTYIFKPLPFRIDLSLMDGGVA